MTRGARKSHIIRLEGCRRNKLKKNIVVRCYRLGVKNWWLGAGRGQLSKITLQGLLSISSAKDPLV